MKKKIVYVKKCKLSQIFFKFHFCFTNKNIKVVCTDSFKLEIKPNILLLDEPFSALDYQTRIKVSDDVYLVETRHTLYVVKDRTIPGNTKLVGMYETPRVGDRFSCFDVTDCNKAERRVYQTSTIKSVDFLSQEVCEVKTKNSTYYCYF